MWGFLLASLLIELTPGPNMTWLAVVGARHGRRAALAAVAGVCLGLGLAGLVAGFGLTVLFNTFPSLLTALRVAGTLYLLYLAYDAWIDADDEDVAAASYRTYFSQGFVSNALNPKAYLFYAAILPQFLSPDAGWPQIAWLTALYVAVATGVHTAIALASGSLAGWLKHSPQAVILRRVLAALIGLAAIWFFISTGNLK
ncbi:LysE family translocator [Aestuariivirga litoralis]|uniref:LysE family translocator n=1 Tax=Aestuariivirga litoralis TaxID=2650924 RepID=UPI0018C7C41E|nr:LysE family translocator [Aestuariivirga litoralis]MBG1230926.1 LysE family translocator [Aestuariivirga litoralis]